MQPQKLQPEMHYRATPATPREWAVATALVYANRNALGEHDAVDGTIESRQELFQRSHQLLRTLLVAALRHIRHAHRTDVLGRQSAFACVAVGEGDRVRVVEILDHHDRGRQDLAGALSFGRANACHHAGYHQAEQETAA